MLTPKLIQRIKSNEGDNAYQKAVGHLKNDKFHCYKDSLGYWTIGYGHLLKEHSEPISQLTADIMLQQDVANAAKDVSTLVKLDEHPEIVQMILVETCFQLGLTKLRNFKKMLRAFNEHDYKTAAKEMKDSNWYRQTTKRVERYIKELNDIK